MNIVLIGMPGAGKSTTGPALAKRLDMGFVDTDSLLVGKTSRELKDIVAEDGYEFFLKLQEELILSLEYDGMVIATGGSVVCSDSAMQHLKREGVIVYLKQTLEDVEKRLSPGRRLARSSDKTIEQVYSERCPLYEKYADITVNCSDKSVEAIVDEVLAGMKAKK